jgi:hypothetical protein
MLFWDLKKNMDYSYQLNVNYDNFGVLIAKIE